MNKIYYKKNRKPLLRAIRRLTGLLIAAIGIGIALYIFAPLLLWQFFIAPVLKNQDIAVPIPQSTLVTPGTIQSLLASQVNAFSGVNFDDAKNWFPQFITNGQKANFPYYAISIPRLHITNAVVSTVDTDLTKHLVNFSGTGAPPDKGNPVIFGHSTLPQLYNPKDYKTIFANIQNMQIGDEILVNVNNITYTYKIFSIKIIDPEDTSVLAQTTDDSYLTLITCTPPGTIWKRLVLKSRLQAI